jgi:uncharacterized membrane protein
VTVAGFLVALSVILFLLFFEHVIHKLRPVAVAELVARKAERMTTRVIARAEAEGRSSKSAEPRHTADVTTHRYGAIQAVSIRGLVAWASRHDQFVTMQSSIGDFVDSGQVVFTVSGASPPPKATVRRLRGMIALGVERTIEQDVAFAIRIIVDIAIKALSAAINDPTTAVQAIDHLEPVLRRLGSTALQQELIFHDRHNVARLHIRGRTWEDYLALGTTEIREYGCGAVQVTRRLRAMLDGLQETVLPENRAAVESEISRLRGSLAAGFSGSVDIDLASVSDRQGIGSPHPATAYDSRVG